MCVFISTQLQLHISQKGAASHQKWGIAYKVFLVCVGKMTVVEETNCQIVFWQKYRVHWLEVPSTGTKSHGHYQNGTGTNKAETNG